MNTSKFLASTAAAVMVAGSIGFAYAQTAAQDSTPKQSEQQYQGTTPAQTGPATVNPNMNIQRQGGATDGMDRSTTGGMGRSTTGDTRNMGNERLARADRN